MTEIQIPDEAIQVLLAIGDGIYETDEEVLEDARKIALPVLAAELEHVVADLEGLHADGGDIVVLTEKWCRRARELRGEG